MQGGKNLEEHLPVQGQKQGGWSTNHGVAWSTGWQTSFHWFLEVLPQDTKKRLSVEPQTGLQGLYTDEIKYTQTSKETDTGKGETSIVPAWENQPGMVCWFYEWQSVGW